MLSKLSDNASQLRNEQPTHKLNSVVCFLTAVIRSSG